MLFSTIFSINVFCKEPVQNYCLNSITKKIDIPKINGAVKQIQVGTDNDWEITTGKTMAFQMVINTAINTTKC